MAGALPRPKRRSTNCKPEGAPEEVLYTDTDRSGDTLDLDLSSLRPNPFNKRAKKGVPELATTIKEVGLLQSIAHIRAEVWLETYPETLTGEPAVFTEEAPSGSGSSSLNSRPRCSRPCGTAPCRVLLESTDVTDPANSDLILSVLRAAVLAPPQQFVAQQRAFIWLKETGRHGLDAADAASYFAAIQDSDDATVQRLAAFTAALGTAELRTTARRQSGGSRERNHVRVLQEHADYEPQTEWEKAERGPVAAGGPR